MFSAALFSIPITGQLAKRQKTSKSAVDYSIVRIKIKSRKRAGDISGRADARI